MRTRVKICGITRRQDAEFAVEMGADALGLVFYANSPRAVNIAQAQTIVKHLPPFTDIVALFVNADKETVTSCIEQLPITCLQFHGDETSDFCEQFSMPYLKAIRMREPKQLIEAVDDYATASALLLDSYQAGVPGGTGQVFDWSMVSSVDKPLILAGGLNADNVRMAIEQVHPYAVDVSGGVERDKGIKDKLKIRAFMQEVNHG